MYFISELCQNHGGDKNQLIRMINEAAGAGSTHVKIQSIFSKDVTNRKEFERLESDSTYFSRPYIKEVNRLRGLELSLDDHKFFIDYSHQKDLIPLTTIFTKDAAEKIAELEWPVSIVKVASYDGMSFPLIDILASKFKHLIISTGACYDEEIIEVNNKIKEKHPNVKVSYLHCVTKYPQKVSDGRLLRINWLKQFSHSIGLSDHSGRDFPVFLSKVAIYLGIDYLERHFTSRKFNETKDGPVSINKHELSNLVDFAKKDKETQLSELTSEYGRDLLNKSLTYQQSMSTIDEVKTRNYYRGRFASKNKDGSYNFNWHQ